MSSNIQRYTQALHGLFDTLYPKLNSAQRDAVYATEGPVLVLAGAGSGKTTVLVNRIAHILKFGSLYSSIPENVDDSLADMMENALKYAEESPGSIDVADMLSSMSADRCPPWALLSITFTNKAAKEMKTRLEAILGGDAAEVWAGTFHSVCVRMLRQGIDRLGYSSDFTIYDTDDCRKVLSAVMKALNVDDKRFVPKAVANEISRAKDRLQSPEDFAREAGSELRLKTVARIYEKYQEELRRSNALDFDDIIMLTVLMLLQNEDIRQRWQKRFRYILVDEYQDTNLAQFRLVAILGEKSRNVMVVGDDDQSIYKFRGATIENILSFDRQFKDARVIKLEQNYRSTSVILEAANSVIKNNSERKGKNLWTSKDGGELITQSQLPTQNEEASFIADTILTLQGQGRSYGDFAVLYRTNAQSNLIESALAKSGIPFRLLGGLRFYERKEIKDMMAYLSVINNPSDSVRLKRIINEPSRKIGEATIQAVEQLAVQNGISMFEVVKNAQNYPALSRAANRLVQFGEIITKLQYVAANVPLPELVEEVVALTGYGEYLGEAEAERLENIKELISNTISYYERVPEPSLGGFLEEAALVMDIDNYDSSADAAVLMTIHSAKGLEFPVVFLPGMEDGLFPSQQNLFEPEQLEEERRLAYVAITRAKEKLYILHTASRLLYGRTTFNPISMFAAEIPEGLVDKSVCDAPARPPVTYSHNTLPFKEQKKQLPDKSELQKPFVSSAPKPEERSETFKTGDVVVHANFGQGMVLSAKNMGGDMLYEIAFDKAGTKRLMASFAKLKRA